MSDAQRDRILPAVGPAVPGRLRGAVALFNDTGDVAHVGCLAVSDANRRLLRRAGLELRRVFYHRDWQSLAGIPVERGIEAALRLPGLRAALDVVDAVLVNGEGSIHHGYGRHLLAILGAAQRLGLPTHVFNAVIQDIDHDHGIAVLRALTGLAVRDRFSSEWLAARGIRHELGWDSIIEAGFAESAAHDFADRVVLTECHPDLAARLRVDLDRVRARFGGAVAEYRIEDRARSDDWRHALADLRAVRLLVTARHHAVYLALMAGVPFVPLPSNTWKIEGLLRRFDQFPEWFARLEGSIDERIDWALQHPEAFSAAAAMLAAARPLVPFRAVGAGALSAPTAESPHARSTQTDDLARAVGQLATGGDVLCVGARDSGVLRALRSAGFRTRFVEPAIRLAGADSVQSLDELPVDKDAFHVVLAGSWVEEMDETRLPDVLCRLAQAAIDLVLLVVTGRPSVQSAPTWKCRRREWWEAQCIAAGMRRHPAALRLVAYEDLEHEGDAFVVAMQKVPTEAGAQFTLDGLRVERDLHMDMLREPGRRSDAHLARYDLAARYIRPGDWVIDAACGLGYGSAMLWDLSEAQEVRGIDLGEQVVRYAAAHYCRGRPGLGYAAADATELPGIADASVDCVVSFETMEHLEHPEQFVDSVARVLRPGGRFICSIPNEWVDETGKDPNPYHLHVFDLDRLIATCSRRLMIDEVYIQSAGGQNHRFRAVRTLQRIPWPPGPETPPRKDAEWWIVVAMLDPVGGAQVPYRETVFPARDPARVPHATAFARDYDNPWLVHSMVMGPYRARSSHLLEDIATRALRAARPGSADAGAALCVLAYQLLAGVAGHPSVRDRVTEAIRGYVAHSAPCAHAARWRISLQFALALMAQQDGRTDEAERLFRTCSESDFMEFGPHLATKCSEACFHAGRLAMLRGDTAQAAADWRRVFGVLSRVPWEDAAQLLVNADRPSYFEFGDGMREVTIVADNAVRCANGLRVLAHLRGGRSMPGLSWDRSFQTVQAELVAGAASHAWETQVLRSTVVDLTLRNDQLQQRLVELGERNALLAARIRRRGRRGVAPGMNKVVIFGAGEGGRRVWEAISLMAAADIVCFVDNDARKRGHGFLGLEVRAPDTLRAGGFELVIVASVYAAEIVPQIQAIGVDPACVWVPVLSVTDAELRRSLAEVLPPPESPAATNLQAPLRVCIFGTGQGGTKVWEALMSLDHLEPAWFADNDTQKHGQKFLGLEVVAPVRLVGLPVDRVVIASMHRDAIRAQIVGMGYDSTRVVTPDVTASFSHVLREITEALPAPGAL